MDNDFFLIPFSTPVTSIEEVSGSISLHNGYLVITYRVIGDIRSINMPQPQASPIRRDGLWQESCFECFVQGVGREDYNEVNLSSNGDWNVYHFPRYRTGMVEESTIDNIDSTISVEPDKVVIHCSVPLHGSHEMTSSVQVGISCILLHRSNTMSYWSLIHPGQKPDFHDSRAFRMKLTC